MEALRRSVGQPGGDLPSAGKKPPRKRANGQKETLMPIEGKKQAKASSKKVSHKPQRRSA